MLYKYINGNGRYDVKDFLKYENSEILNMSKVKGERFGVVLMNPPYGALPLKFLDKACEISNIVVSVQPAGWISLHTSGGFAKSLYKKCREIINTYYADVTYIKGREFFDAGINSDMSVNYIDMTKKDNRIILHRLNGKTEIVNNQNDILAFADNDYLVDFYKKISEYSNKVETIWDISKFTPLYKHSDKTEYEPDYNWWCIFIARDGSLLGHVDAKTGNKRDDYYTYIPKNEKYQRAFKYTEDRSQQYFVVKNEEEGKNAIHYLMSDFARLCCYVSRETIGRFGYQFLPALDFSKSYTEEELFNMIGMEYSKEEIDKILPDFYGTRK